MTRENIDKAFVQNWKNISKNNFEDKVGKGGVSWYPLVGKDEPPSKDLVCGVATLEADETGFLALHHHKPAEIYYILSGNGIVEVDGVEYPVNTDDCIYIPSDAEHSMLNTGSIPLHFIYILTGNKFSDITYHFNR